MSRVFDFDKQLQFENVPLQRSVIEGSVIPTIEGRLRQSNQPWLELKSAQPIHNARANYDWVILDDKGIQQAKVEVKQDQHNTENLCIELATNISGVARQEFFQAGVEAKEQLDRLYCLMHKLKLGDEYNGSPGLALDDSLGADHYLLYIREPQSQSHLFQTKTLATIARRSILDGTSRLTVAQNNKDGSSWYSVSVLVPLALVTPYRDTFLGTFVLPNAGA